MSYMFLFTLDLSQIWYVWDIRHVKKGSLFGQYWGFYGRGNDGVFCLLVNSLQWRHNGRDSVSNHQPHDCLLNRLFRRRSKKTSKLRVTGLCAGNSSGTGEFPAQMASNAENVPIWWRHHVADVKTLWGHYSIYSVVPLQRGQFSPIFSQ